jgi:hypothetical protein
MSGWRRQKVLVLVDRAGVAEKWKVKAAALSVCQFEGV